MPASRPVTLLIALAIGAAEALALLAYGISIISSSLISGSSGSQGSDVSPWILLAAYVAFALLIALVVRGLWRGSAVSRTPFLLAQAFAIVVAQTLVAGSEPFEKVLGWSCIVLALAGAVCILSKSASGQLH